MVRGSSALKKRHEVILLSAGDLNWSSITLSDVLERRLRLEANVFDVKGKHARQILQQCEYEIVPLVGKHGMANAYHRPRFKRIFVEKSEFPIFQPSQITELCPKPSLYISGNTKTNIDSLRVHRNQILLTCSGTIGKCTVVSKTLDNKIFSHDGLRISAKKGEDTGYIYAFLQTKIGQTLLQTNNYGAVVQHIEPEHLEYVPIPNPQPPLKHSINKTVMDSFALRDESNELIDEAQRLLMEELHLISLDKLIPSAFKKDNIKVFDTKLSKMQGRMEGTYHTPLIESQ